VKRFVREGAVVADRRVKACVVVELVDPANRVLTDLGDARPSGTTADLLLEGPGEEPPAEAARAGGLSLSGTSTLAFSATLADQVGVRTARKIEDLARSGSTGAGA
jgi:hypothetical protein